MKHSAWETVIGLEVHTQLSTQSKLFSSSPTTFGAAPNTQANLVDLGFPGILPVLNARAVDMAILFGLGTHATINTFSRFERKNYFYPDLPKGYQISQFHIPIIQGGYLDICLADGTQKRIGITRAHLEEDAGKSLHDVQSGCSGIDLNRAGIPLLEIVSEPELRSAEEAVAYLKTLHALVRYLGICDGNMQEGSFRCDANVSVRRVGDTNLGTRTEIKNVNSFRFVEKAIIHEAQRQIALIENGETVAQETRLYDADNDVTRSMRTKESAHDYRYFPDPDLLPIIVTADHIQSIRATLPELPMQKRERFEREYALSAYDASVLTSERELAEYFESVVKNLPTEHAKLAANWVMGELSAALNKNNLVIAQSPISAAQLSGLLMRIIDNTISGKIAKTVFEGMWNGEGDADQVISKRGLKQVSDAGALIKLIDEVLAANPTQLAEYRSGKDKLFGFFAGQVMKISKGQANPAALNPLLMERLSK